MTTPTPTPPVVVAALYKFVTLSDFEALREPLRQTMLDNGVKGTLLLAKEGINGTVPVAAKVLTRCWLGSPPTRALPISTTKSRSATSRHSTVPR